MTATVFHGRITMDGGKESCEIDVFTRPGNVRPYQIKLPEETLNFDRAWLTEFIAILEEALASEPEKP